MLFRSTEMDHMERSPKAQMREADRIGLQLCQIIGEDEINGEYYTLRDMSTGTQERIPKSNLFEDLRKQLAMRNATGLEG